MASRRRPAPVALSMIVALAAAAWGIAATAPRAELGVESAAATVGDRLAATLTVDLPAGSSFDPPAIGPTLGPVSVFSGAWAPPTETEEGMRWQWNGTLSAFETGDLEIPALSFEATGPDGPIRLSTEPVKLQVTSVLEDSGAEAELSDIKPPVSLPADYSTVVTALAIFGALLVASLILWWMHRRYAARLAAVPAPIDPFQRMPPHEWVYRELQLLLERRVAEQGQVDVFYSELANVLKRYLEGRYRADLMELTTAEVGSRLAQAGAPEEARQATLLVLGRCDQVKFARERPGPEAWRAEIEAVYAIVDRTKPVETAPARVGRGAA